MNNCKIYKFIDKGVKYIEKMCRADVAQYYSTQNVTFKDTDNCNVKRLTKYRSVF